MYAEMKLSEIRKFNAKDVSDVKLPNNCNQWKVIAISRGVYGLNGAVFENSKGEFFKITKRCSNLAYMI